MVFKLKKVNKSEFFLSKLLLFSIFFIILLTGTVLCQSKINNNLTIGGGTYFSVFQLGFLEEYNKLIGGRKNDFMHHFAPFVEYSVNWSDSYSIAIKANFVMLTIEENFLKETFTNSNFWRLHLENIKLNAVPILLVYKITDNSLKYRTYASFGVGATFAEIEWFESVNTPIPNDPRIGGQLLDKKVVSPTLSTTIGTELMFDPESVPKIFAGIAFSLDLVYTYRYEKVFEKLQKQFYPPEPKLGAKYSVVPFILGFNLGIIFNLNNKTLNRVFG